MCFSPDLCKAPYGHRVVSSWVGSLYAKIDLKSSEMAWNECKINRRDI